MAHYALTYTDRYVFSKEKIVKAIETRKPWKEYYLNFDPHCSQHLGSNLRSMTYV